MRRLPGRAARAEETRALYGLGSQAVKCFDVAKEAEAPALLPRRSQVRARCRRDAAASSCPRTSESVNGGTICACSLNQLRSNYGADSSFFSIWTAFVLAGLSASDLR